MERAMQNISGDSYDTQQFVVFQVGNELYGINILIAESIERIQPITRVPKSPSEIIGVINLRGDIVPLISMRKILEYDEEDYTDSTRIIITEFDDYRLGLIVDRLLEVLTISTNDIQLSIDDMSDKDKIYISGIINMGDQPITLIDIPKTLEKINIIDKQGV